MFGLIAKQENVVDSLVYAHLHNQDMIPKERYRTFKSAFRPSILEKNPWIPRRSRILGIPRSLDEEWLLFPINFQKEH